MMILRYVNSEPVSIVYQTEFTAKQKSCHMNSIHLIYLIFLEPNNSPPGLMYIILKSGMLNSA